MKIFKYILRIIFVGLWITPILLCFNILTFIFIPQMRLVDYVYSWKCFGNWLKTGNRKEN